MDSSVSQAASGALFLAAFYVSRALGLWLLFKALQALYNISPFHPLSSIPGPRLAAATYLPEFYYDVVKFGCYTKEISQMHKTYGKYTISWRM